MEKNEPRQDRVLKIYRSYVAAWNDHDLDSIIEQFHNESKFDSPMTEGALDLESTRRHFERLLEGFPDINFDEVIITTKSPNTIVSRWVSTGTHSGWYQDIPPTENTIQIEGVSIYEITDDGIQSIEAYFDMNELKDQLSLSLTDLVYHSPEYATNWVSDLTPNTKLLGD